MVVGHEDLSGDEFRIVLQEREHDASRRKSYNCAWHPMAASFRELTKPFRSFQMNRYFPDCQFLMASSRLKN